MKSLKFIIASTILLCGGAAYGQAPIRSAEMIEMTRDSYIFVFDSSVSQSSARGRAERMVDGVQGQLGHVYTNTIVGFSARMPFQAAQQLTARNPNIAYFEADQIAYPFPPPWCRDNPDDPRCGGDGGDGGDGSGGPTPNQSTPWGITRVKGGTAVSSLGTAYVIDTGVDLDHEDLNVDVANSVDFVSRGKDNGGDDPDGHGTHVAGTIAAIDNNFGVVGVAPGANIVSVRVLSRNGGSYSDVIAGVDHVASVGGLGDVANMSLGGGFSQALNNAVVNAASNGVVFVIAAGNSGANANNYSPASANGPNVVTVSAFSEGDNWASFSNYSNPPIDWAGPGVGIESTYRDNGYAVLSGTSMAAPHVAGVILASGNCQNGGVVSDDPDGSADPICER